MNTLNKITFDTSLDLCKWLIDNPTKSLYDSDGRVWRTLNNKIYFRKVNESFYTPTKNPYFTKTELTIVPPICYK
mgnify:FL=1